MSNNVLHRDGGNDVTGPDGPPILHAFFHNAYGMEMARATDEGLRRLRSERRPFVLTRSGTAGMQRYAALWTGDNSSRWEHISLAILRHSAACQQCQNVLKRKGVFQTVI